MNPPRVADCVLCGASTRLWFADSWRHYFHCRQCRLVHVPACQHLSTEQEKAQYDLHENRVDDPRYRQFLKRLADPVLTRVAAPARGLDFGCGPGPALADILSGAGLDMHCYDPFYYPNRHLLSGTYQLITATEVVEHLARPGEELRHIWSLLESGGWLGIMTSWLPDLQDFAQWHYRRDPTHICFFSSETFLWLATRWQARSVVFPTDNVVLIQKT